MTHPSCDYIICDMPVIICPQMSPLLGQMCHESRGPAPFRHRTPSARQSAQDIVGVQWTFIE